MISKFSQPITLLDFDLLYQIIENNEKLKHMTVIVIIIISNAIISKCPG